VKLPYEPVLGKNPELIPVSNSEIQTFKDCRRKWWLSYYLGLGSKEQKTSGALAFGTRIHKCLEGLYKDGISPLETHTELVSEVQSALFMAGRDDSEFQKEIELGRIMLEGYMEWLEETGADSDLEIIDSEKKLSLPMYDGKVELRGKIDLRVKRKQDSASSLLDFKTVANRETYVKLAHMAEQLKLYILLENASSDSQRVDGGIYRLLKKVKRTATAKPPFYEDYDVRHNKNTLNSFWAALHGVVAEMLDLRGQLDAGADPNQVAYPTPTNDCSWKCPFYSGCPMFDDGSRVDEWVESIFEQYDPYQRYEENSE
jgi:RecB family exonuclease